jgi:hypothetical protein
MPKVETPSILKSPASQAVYTKLAKALDRFGSYEVEEKKTSLHLTRRRAFAGIHPRANGVVLNLVFDTPLEDARVHKCERVSANRCHVEFKLEDPNQVDAQLVGWMQRAYSLAE